jgi:hypothetical protein
MRIAVSLLSLFVVFVWFVQCSVFVYLYCLCVVFVVRCWFYNCHLCCLACAITNTYWSVIIIIIIIIITITINNVGLSRHVEHRALTPNDREVAQCRMIILKRNIKRRENVDWI